MRDALDFFDLKKSIQNLFAIFPLLRSSIFLRALVVSPICQGRPQKHSRPQKHVQDYENITHCVFFLPYSQSQQIQLVSAQETV